MLRFLKAHAKVIWQSALLAFLLVAAVVLLGVYLEFEWARGIRWRNG